MPLMPHMSGASRPLQGRAFLMPSPGGADDLIKTGHARNPPELFISLAGIADEPGRISGPPLANNNRHGKSSDTPGGRDHLLNGKPSAGAKIVRARSSSALKRL